MLQDQLCLGIQVILLGGLIVRDFFQPQRNLYLIIICATLLVLVQGQAWWILNQFQDGTTTTISHLYQTIDIESAKLANLYVGLCVVVFAITYWLISKSCKAEEQLKLLSLPKQRFWQGSTWRTNITVSVWVIVLAGALIALLGGFQEVVDRPGASIGGQTFLLIMIGMGKLPLLRKLLIKRKVSKFEILLFCLTFFIVLLNSRFSAAFIIIQLTIVFNYCYKQISRRLLLGSFVVFFSIFIVYGLYRDNAILNVGSTANERYGALIDRFDNSESPLDWFYRTNVEGFAGLAGILTYEKASSAFAHDYGISNVALIIQLLPNSIRKDKNVLGEVGDLLDGLYPYLGGSVVPPGLEAAYAHFGVFGIILMGVILGYLAGYLHKIMLNPCKNRLQIALLSVQSFNLIRTMVRFALFFALGDLVVLNLYKLILKNSKSSKLKKFQP